MRKSFRNSFYRKMQLSFLLLVLLPLLFVGLLTVNETQSGVKERLKLGSDSVLTVMSKDITKLIDDVAYSSTFFVQEKRARELLLSFRDTDRIRSSADVDRYNEIKDSFNLLAAKTVNPDIILFLANRRDFLIQALEDRFLDGQVLVDSYRLVKPRVDETKLNVIQWLGMAECNGKPYYFMARSIQTPANGLLATLYMAIPESHFQELFDQIHSGSFSLYDADGLLIAGDSRIPFHTDDSKDRNVRSELLLPKSGWKLINEIPGDEITGQIRSSLFKYLPLLLPFFIMFVFVTMLTVRRLYVPLRLLQRDIRLFGEGNLMIRFRMEGEDEWTQLGRTLNEMRDRILQLIEQVRREEETKREFELQALYAQIRPHFLLNTLNSIKCNLALADDPVHSRQVDSLMSLLRAYTKPSEMSTLESESILLGHYVEIMIMRSEREIRFLPDIPPELKEFALPRLLLQPLVENAILHGGDEEESALTIELSAREAQGRVIIQLTDDGVGIPPERLARLNDMLSAFTPEAAVSYERVGLVNVLQRLRLIYGDSAAMRLYGQTGRGTRVEMDIPRETANR